MYYLPAYLRAALRLIAVGHAMDHLVGWPVFHVTNFTSNYALARLKRLSDAQIDAVISFLDVVRNHGGFTRKMLSSVAETGRHLNPAAGRSFMCPNLLGQRGRPRVPRLRPRGGLPVTLIR